MESNSNDFPEELIREILLRLPVKTLVRFKCVCRHWCTLIGSSCFVNQHFGHKSNQEHRLIRCYSLDKKRVTYALFGDETFSEYEEPDHLQMPDAVSTLLGPLNGVFCVVGSCRSMALLNPAMRQFKPLPLLNINVEPYLEPYDDLLGFGLDPLTGDYKLVFIQFLWNKELDAEDYPCRVFVYNSGSDSWRDFEDANLVNSSYYGNRSLCNTYLNGVYYWLIHFDDPKAAILAFDMSNEKFQQIQVPDCIKSGSEDLTLCGDSLALLTRELDNNDKCVAVDVWIMKKEGCWVKSSSVGHLQDISWPLGFWKNDELLLAATRSSLLALCNVATQKLGAIESPRSDNVVFNYPFLYKESLVSIKGEGEKCMHWDTSSEFVTKFLKY